MRGILLDKQGAYERMIGDQLFAPERHMYISIGKPFQWNNRTVQWACKVVGNISLTKTSDPAARVTEYTMQMANPQLVGKVLLDVDTGKEVEAPSMG